MLYYFPIGTGASMHIQAERTGPDAATAVRRAEAICRARAVRFTPLRRRVFELIVEADQPLTAYELLARLAANGGRPAPPTVYRTLEFLQAQGLVHRLASRSRWVMCRHPDHAHAGLFLVCSSCGRVTEWTDERIAHAVHASARAAGFSIAREVLPEVEGVCGSCRNE